MAGYENKILNALVDSYENSLLSRGENKVAIHIAFPFTKKTMPEYFDESSLKYEDIHACLRELERKGFLEIVWKCGKENHIVQKVLLNVEKLSVIYQSLGRTPKSEHIRLLRERFERLRARYQTPVASCFIHYLDERLAEGKSVKEFIEISDPDRTEHLIRAIALVEENTAPCYIREFSITHFRDSKAFETILSTVGKVFRRFSEEKFADAEDKAILAEYGIYHTPDYVYIKGEGRIVVQGNNIYSYGEGVSNARESLREEVPIEEKDSLQGLYSDAKERMAAILDLNLLHQGIGLSGEDLDNVHILGTLKTNRVITIENLTTFFLWQEKDSLIIYLGGYHNSVRRRLLRMIHEQVPQAEYLHFGDIDVGGFEIYEDLCGKTGIAFQPYHMGIKELEKYQSYTRPLTEHDRKRLDFLLEKKRKDSDCVYLEVLEYMKKHGIKLEQECIQS